MAAEDAGEEFTEMLGSIGRNTLALIRTIMEERKRREAQKAAMEKEQRSEEMAERRRMEDREFMKSENEKMRSELRDVLKANGMETSDKNLDLAQKHAEKMLANETQIEANLAEIGTNNAKIGANQSKIDANKAAFDKIDTQIGTLAGNPDNHSKILQLQGVQKELTAMNRDLDGENQKLKDRNRDLGNQNKDLEASNIMLKNGQGLEGLQTDLSVKNDLIKQMDRVNTGIALDNKKLAGVNEQIAKNEEASKKALNPPDGSVPNMKEWERLGAEKQDLLKQREGIQKDLSEKQGLLKGLKEGKTLEQLQQAAKLDGQAALAKEKVQGIDNVINGYKKNETAIIDKHKEIMKNGGNLKQSDYDELSEVRNKIKGYEAEKDTAQKEVAKLEKEANDLRNAPPKVDGAKVEGPKEVPQGPEVPQMPGAGKMVQGHGGGITSPGTPIMEVDKAPQITTTPKALEQEAPMTLEVDDLNKKGLGPQVGAKEEAIGPEVPKEKLSSPKISPENSAKIGETPKDHSSLGTSLKGSKDDGGVGLKSPGKKSVLEELDSRGETPEYVLRKRGMSLGQGMGQKKGVGVH